MPELPVLSGSELVRLLRSLGFERARQRGSHVVLLRGDRGCVVPLHPELKRGTLAGIWRQAGVGRDELIEAQRRG